MSLLVPPFRVGDLTHAELENILNAHRGNAAIGIVNEASKHISSISSYQRYANGGDDVRFYHEQKSPNNGDSSAQITARKGDLCLVGSADTIEKELVNYRQRFSS